MKYTHYTYIYDIFIPIGILLLDDDILMVCAGGAEPTNQLHSPIVDKVLPHLLQVHFMSGMLSGHSELVTPLPGKHTDGPRNRHNIIRQHELHVI